MGKLINSESPITSVNGIQINRSLMQTFNCTEQASRAVSYIVVHFTGNKKDTAKANANYFHQNLAAAGLSQASAHFFVDDDSIFQSVALKDIAWHCGTSKAYYHALCRNANSVGVEMCTTAGDFTVGEKALENAAQLVAALCGLLGIAADQVDTFVLRHYDITHKVCPAQFCTTSANLAAWKTFKDRVREILGGQKEETPAFPYVLQMAADSPVVTPTVCKRGTKYTITEEITIAGKTYGKLKSGAGYVLLADGKKT